MMWATVLTVCRKELTDHLRDRRTAAMIFFLSIAMGPLLLIGLTQFISSVEKKAEAREVLKSRLFARDSAGLGEKAGPAAHVRTRFHLVPLAVSSMTTPRS